MSRDSWLHNLRSTLSGRPGDRESRRRRSLKPATQRLHLEPLEDRRLLAFLPPVDYAAGSAPMDMVSADFKTNGSCISPLANSSPTVFIPSSR